MSDAQLLHSITRRRRRRSLLVVLPLAAAWWWGSSWAARHFHLTPDRARLMGMVFVVMPLAYALEWGLGRLRDDRAETAWLRQHARNDRRPSERRQRRLQVFSLAAMLFCVGVAAFVSHGPDMPGWMLLLALGTLTTSRLTVVDERSRYAATRRGLAVALPLGLAVVALDPPDHDLLRTLVVAVVVVGVLTYQVSLLRSARDDPPEPT